MALRQNRKILVISFLLAAVLFLIPATADAESRISFTDISATHWAKESIDSLVQLGVVSGFSDNTFRPDEPVTREQFAQLITLAFYLDLPGDDSVPTFVDVSKSRWSYNAVEAAKDFLTGYYPPSGRAFFDPTGKATREDVAVALVRVLGYQPDELQNENILQYYYDSDKISPNLRTYMALAVEKKLLLGYNDFTLRPLNPVTRAEAAALLYRVLKNAVGDSRTDLVLNVDAPETVSTPTFYITGDVTKGAKVYLNNKEVEVVQGQFRVAIRLDEEGIYTYTISARLPGGKTAFVTKQVKYERGAPELTVSGIPEISDKQRIKITWNVKDENDPSPEVYVNDQKQFGNSLEIDLKEGENIIVVRAENRFGKSAEVVRRVFFQADGPIITFVNLPESTSKERVTVNWKVQDKNDPDPDVYVNNQRIFIGTSIDLTLKEGSNPVTVKAVNKLGKTTEVTRTIEFIPNPPQLVLGPLPDTTDKETITVTWRVQDDNDPSPMVYVNNTPVNFGTSTNLKLAIGMNTISVRAVNKYGKSTEVTKTIHFASEGPTIQINPVPATTGKGRIDLVWTLKDANDSSPRVYVNDKYYNSSPATVVLKEGDNTIVVRAVNRLGQSTEQTINVTFVPPAPVITLKNAPETSSSPRIFVTWSVFDENDGSPKVFVNERPAVYNGMELSLSPGENEFRITAVNSYGKTSEVIYKVTYETAQQ